MTSTHGRSAFPTLSRSAAAVSAALAALAAAPAIQAQTDPEATARLERVEITGSSIKRVDAETALPVQIIKREEIVRSGVTTAAELLGQVSANSAALTDGTSFSDIAGQRGFNGANLRGIGVSSTLILLNGRRLANFASPGGNAGVDLNSIPAAAIDRVEVLKDGASAIYGSDAIGGVINFITRRDYRGIDASAYASGTQHGGAAKNIFTLSGGAGDLAADRYNVFGVLDYQDAKSLRSTQRDWIGSAYQPDINLDVGSSNTFPANVRATRASGSATGPRYNPAAPNCNPPATVYAPGSFVGSRACLYDYMHDTEIFPASKRLSFMGRGQFALDAQNTLFAEVLHADTKTQYRISPLTVTNLNYPANGPFYPTAFAAANGLSGPLRVNMRLSEAGGRTNDVKAIADRVLLGAKGAAAGWDYDGALNYSVNRVTDAYVDGYVQTAPFDTAFLSGVINPFGPSGAAGSAALQAAKINDDARQSRGKTMSADVKASRSLFAMAGGDAAVAVGAELRRETLSFTPSALLAAGQIRGDGPAVAFEGGRTVAAAFTEFNLPILKTLEAQLAVRYDHYSDFGGTTNPKVGLRWTPLAQLVVRGSYGRGFRAPSLADLYSPSRTGQTNGIYDDPLGCVNNGQVDNTDNPDYCGIQPDKLVGGSSNLKPEKSKQYTAGLVFEASRDFSASLDYWRIEKSNGIVSPEGVYFTDPAGNAAYINRGPTDPTLPGIPGPITSIDSRLRNIGSLKTSGLDLGVDWKLPANEIARLGIAATATYVIDYKTRADAGASEVSGVGVFANDQVVQRWRYHLAFNLDRGPWSATLLQTFYSGYRDQNSNPDGSDRHVGSYSLWDLTAGLEVTQALRLRAGVRNLFDTHPPRSNQVYSFLAGYDPSYTDPRGRSFFASVAYSFH